MLAGMLAGCNAHQSALAPFGQEARETLWLTIILVVAATLLFAGVIAVYIRAVTAPEGRLDHRGGMRVVLWMGAIGPTILLTVLLLFALPAMRPLPSEPEDLRIRVEGEQFWWRVAYDDGKAAPLVTANEVRIPVGRTVAFDLAATDVIHSFWIPGLAGKMDMIPGRTNRLVVKAEKAGRYRGACTEFCGLSHALMAFDVIAMDAAEFDGWLANARAAASGSEIARAGHPGAAVFDRYGCGACHAIGGTGHNGRIGPDLTRYGDRLSLGAGTLEPTLANTAAFIRESGAFKPGSRMPSYKGMPEDDARAVAAYLESLK